MPDQPMRLSATLPRCPGYPNRPVTIRRRVVRLVTATATGRTLAEITTDLPFFFKPLWPDIRVEVSQDHVPAWKTAMATRQKVDVEISFRA